MRISDYLLEGKNNAISAKDLASLIGCSTREVSASVQQERNDGILICATCNPDSPGYYIASSPEEAVEYRDVLSRRINEIIRTRNAFDRALYDKLGQERLW